MSIPYRTRRTLNRVGTVAAIFLLLFLIGWICWVVWLQRYVVFTDDGAKLDFAHSANEIIGEIPVPPAAAQNVSIYFNEGADAINVSNDMIQLNGYYIDANMLKGSIDELILQLERLDSGTAIMVDMDGPQGSSFYNTKLAGGVVSSSMDINAIARLLQTMESKGFYTIARISAFQDYYFGLNNVPAGLMHISKKGLWPDGNTYWLDPTSPTTTNWIASQVLELRDMGFDEVLLDQFWFPTSNQYIFNGDKDAALQSAASTLVASCGASNFVLSFHTGTSTFVPPEGRTRLYVSGISATGINQAASQTAFKEPAIQLVFLAESGDTRYDEYSVLRTITVAEEVEARKAG